MSDNSMLVPPGGPAPHVQARPGRQGTALLTAVLIALGGALFGVAAGAIWAAAAPRVVYQVYTLSPPTAYATNPETNAFIAADGWYCFIGLAGGALIGLLGYLFGVRRCGPLPMAGIVVGSVGAAFTTAWVGHELSGGPGFDHMLATSRPGTYIYAPITLGSHGALGFWPLAAAGVAGGIELVRELKARRQASDEGMPMPGMDTFGTRTYLARPANSQTYQGRDGNGQAPGMRPQEARGGSGTPEAQDGGAGR
jgi:hypothetical protein